MLTRDAQRSQRDTERTKEQKQKLEEEWKKAKNDLENEDLLDRLADNPSGKGPLIDFFDRLSGNANF